jgi:hypothetical protein
MIENLHLDREAPRTIHSSMFTVLALLVYLNKIKCTLWLWRREIGENADLLSGVVFVLTIKWTFSYILVSGSQEYKTFKIFSFHFHFEGIVSAIVKGTYVQCNPRKIKKS